MPDTLTSWKHQLFNTNYMYKSAVQNGFNGTEEDWHNYLINGFEDLSIWDGKNNKLGWVSEEDIDAMFYGTYEPTEFSPFYRFPYKCFIFNGIMYIYPEDEIILT